MAKRNKVWVDKVRTYDSKFEERLASGVLKNAEYHPRKHNIPYSIDHIYHPDFIVNSGGYVDESGSAVEEIWLIEAKGRFMDTVEASKYKWIVKQLPNVYRFMFLFANPKLPMPQSRVRKDGTRMTHSEWADKNELEWHDEAWFVEYLK